MIIRGETALDIQAIWDVVRDAFQSEVEANLASALRASGDAVISIVAEDEGLIIGHVMASRLKAPEDCVTISPVSVATDWQGKGVGSKLMHETIERARASGYLAIFLLGNPAYYGRFGFSVSGADRFETSYPKHAFQALELVEGSLASLPTLYTEPAALVALA